MRFTLLCDRTVRSQFDPVSPWFYGKIRKHQKINLGETLEKKDPVGVLQIVSNVVILSDADFEQEVFGATTPVLAYFWATWCGPCRLVAPSVEHISEQYSDRLKVVKMEIDPNPEAVKRCQVEGVPALRVIQGDKIVKSHEGAITRAALAKMIDECLNELLK